MDIEILGPLVVRCENFSATPTAGKPRTVLAMLAMHANEPVPVDLLVKELWGDAAPSSAKTTIQTYVMHLRKLISRAIRGIQSGERRQAKQELVTLPGCYMLTTTQDGVDRWHFERLSAAAHRAREEGDFRAASKQFAEALACWRGRALLDVQVGEHLKIDIKRLEEERLNVLDCRIDADLKLDRHHELLGELAALVQRYPSHEGLAAHLMIAFYRSGRRSDALDVYHKLYICLDKLGLEPSPPLWRLQRTMLVSDHSSSELNDSWNAATAHGRRARNTGSSATSTGGRSGKISAELASISWQAHTMTSEA